MFQSELEITTERVSREQKTAKNEAEVEWGQNKFTRGHGLKPLKGQ